MSPKLRPTKGLSDSSLREGEIIQDIGSGYVLQLEILTLQSIINWNAN